MSSTEATQSRSASLTASLSVWLPVVDRDDLGAEQPHPGDVEGLPLGVDLAHVDGAVEPEQGRGGRGGDAVLAGAGLGDDAGLAHPLGQQGLAEDVVDLVGAGVVEVLALEDDPGAAGVLGEARYLGDDARPPGVGAVQPLQLPDELGVDHGLEADLVELFQGGDQRLGDEPPAELAEPPGGHARTRLFERVPGVARTPTAAKSRTAPAGSPPVTRASPTSTPWAPAAAYSRTSCDAADAGLGDGDDVVGDVSAEPAEHRAVDLEGAQVAGVDPDDGGAGVDGAAGLVLVVDLDESGHAERLGVLPQRDEVASGRGTRR